MKRRGFVRRVILPGLWLLIGIAVAASLVKLAFLGAASADDGDGAVPTGTAQSETVPVTTATIENTLTVDGTIELDPAQAVLAPEDGVLVAAFADPGDTVRKGDRLFQVRTETVPEPSGDPDAPEPKPVRHYYNVEAPVSGRLSGFAVDVGDDVAEDASIATVQPDTFKAVGSISPLDRYRLVDHPRKARVMIEGGPKPFTCRGLTVGDAATATQAPSDSEDPGMLGVPDASDGGGAASKVTCRVPGKVQVFDGLSMSMEIKAGAAKDVLAVPVTAVRGLVGTGSVWVVGPDGVETERSVGLGLTDGKQVEVTSGLKAGEVVLRYVPGSSPNLDDEGGRGIYIEGGIID